MLHHILVTLDDVFAAEVPLLFLADYRMHKKSIAVFLFEGGDLLHLLPLAATVPSVGTQHVTVALGTIVPGPNGNWVFAILPAEGEARDLVLVRYDFQWDRNCCFIKVKAFKEKRHIG